MSVLVKGMAMPKQGRVTLQIGADGAVYVVDKCEITAEKYEKNFEVFEVPPHGRLIDAEKLFWKVYDYFGEDCETAENWMMRVINEAPTVFPADKDGET